MEKETTAKLERVSLSEKRNMRYEKFRTNLRMLRAKEGLSGCEASEKMNLKNGVRILHLEYGRGNPTMDEMISISEYFGVSISDLLEKKAVIKFE